MLLKAVIHGVLEANGITGAHNDNIATFLLLQNFWEYNPELCLDNQLHAK